MNGQGRETVSFNLNNYMGLWAIRATSHCRMLARWLGQCKNQVKPRLGCGFEWVYLHMKVALAGKSYCLFRSSLSLVSKVLDIKASDIETRKHG